MNNASLDDFSSHLKIPRVVQKLNFEPKNFKCGNFNKEIRYEPISEQIMTELESYFINFEMDGDEIAGDEMAENEPTEDKTSKDAEALYNSEAVF